MPLTAAQLTASLNITHQTTVPCAIVNRQLRNKKKTLNGQKNI